MPTVTVKLTSAVWTIVDFCVKSPLSDGKVKRRTKAEREKDKRNGNQRG